ncbi:MAG: peptidyl-prolyl cis-trans isomerase [Ilumatobacteraceae bacterium]|jgi:cyclophilin family peptidyl-prolyl cis-trans isomerase
MRHRSLVVTLSCIGASLGTLLVAAPGFAYTPPETNPRIVVETPQGKILIALAPENAPEHVEQFMIALAAGDFEGANVRRVAPKFYAQVVGKAGTAQLAGLPIEHVKVGNLRGALSVYDSGKPGDAPTLMFVLVKSPQLDTDYTPIGFVEAGKSVLKEIAATPTVGDQQPSTSITLSNIHIATREERARLRQAEVTTTSDGSGTPLLAAIFIIATAAFAAALIASFHDRLGNQRSKSLALVLVLVAFFAVWVALGGSKQGSGLVGVVLFGGSIGIFRLMGKFERPATDELSGAAQPVLLSDGKQDIQSRIDQPEDDLEIVLGQGDAATGRSREPARRIRVAVQEDGRRGRRLTGSVARDGIEVGADDGGVTVDIADADQPLIR